MSNSAAGMAFLIGLATGPGLWIAGSAQGHAAEKNIPLPVAAIADGVDLFTGAYENGGITGVSIAVSDCYGTMGPDQALDAATVCMAADTLGFLVESQASKRFRTPPLRYFVPETWVGRVSEMLKRFPVVDRKTAWKQLLNDTLALMTRKPGQKVR
jgi:hypothetical protein